MITDILDTNKSIVIGGRNVLLDMSTNATRRTSSADEIVAIISILEMIEYCDRNEICDENIMFLYKAVNNKLIKFNKMFY